MYTYDDLKGMIAVECNDINDIPVLLEYFKKHGHVLMNKHADDILFFDISKYENESRAVMWNGKMEYIEDGFKIINISELSDLNVPEIDISEFEEFLIGG